MTKSDPLSVRKNNGEIVPFDPNKLKEALRRSQATSDQIRRVVSEVEKELFDGIPTTRIYQLAYQILRKHSDKSAGRFRLKKALLQIGPTGYPFEHFIGKLLESENYAVQTGVIVPGVCVSHEVDVIAENDREVIMAECKFHRAEGAKSDVKISLYVRARYTDIHQKRQQDTPGDTKKFTPMLITNTRFTEDAIKFGTCSGLRMVSWDYPSGNGLKEMIDRARLFPITVLKSLTKKETTVLLDQGIVLCRQIITHPELLKPLNLSQNREKKLLQEAKAIVESD